MYKIIKMEVLKIYPKNKAQLKGLKSFAQSFDLYFEEVEEEYNPAFVKEVLDRKNNGEFIEYDDELEKRLFADV